MGYPILIFSKHEKETDMPLKDLTSIKSEEPAIENLVSEFSKLSNEAQTEYLNRLDAKIRVLSSVHACLSAAKEVVDLQHV